MSLIRTVLTLLIVGLLTGCATLSSPVDPAPAESPQGRAVAADRVHVAPVVPAEAAALPQVRRDVSIPEITATSPLDDRAIRDRFTELVGDLRESGAAADPAVLREQLGNRTTCDLALPAAREGRLTTAELFAQRRPSALLFGNVYNCGKCSRWHSGMASGFAIGPDVVVTNHHVIANDKAEAFAAMSAAGDVYPILEVLAADELGDAAIVRVAVPEGAAPLVPVPLVEHAPVGARVAVISNPTEQFFTFTEGMVSRYSVFRTSRDGPTSVRMSITADYAKGSSGAPVFDEHGNVCGMVSATSSIYYDRDDDGRQRNLQMVIKRCVPSATILDLIAPTPPAPTAR